MNGEISGRAADATIHRIEKMYNIHKEGIFFFALTMRVTGADCERERRGAYFRLQLATYL